MARYRANPEARDACFYTVVTAMARYLIGTEPVPRLVFAISLARCSVLSTRTAVSPDPRFVTRQEQRDLYVSVDHRSTCIAASRRWSCVARRKETLATLSIRHNLSSPSQHRS